MTRWLIPLFFPFLLFGYEGYIESTSPTLTPWFTGPLISTSGNITPKGHWNIEPYLFATTTTGFYDNDWESKSEHTLWTLEWQLPVFVGLTEWLDVKFNPVWAWKRRENAAHWSLGDTSIQLDFQLYRDSLPSKNWLPSIRLTIRETLPTGKYRNLDRKKQGTDLGGNGTWSTSVLLALSKIIPMYGNHFLDVRFNIKYEIPTPVHVKGLNAYGGGVGTNGTIYPEKICQTSFGFQYNVTRNWALALDVNGQFTSTTRFSGKNGFLSVDNDLNIINLPVRNERDAMIQYSLAPAVEYNWNGQLGLIAGCWFTIAGKNSAKFSSAVIAINYEG